MNFSIGLSGLKVAQRAIELAATNIANVGTDGYHRQSVVIRPLETDRVLGVPIGGSEISQYQRGVDRLLEAELLRQHPQTGQLSQELAALQAVETVFGTLEDSGLARALERFFGSLRELSADPASHVLREQAAWAAGTLADAFRQAGQALDQLDTQIRLEAQNLMTEANALAEEIGQLNHEIETSTRHGATPNLLADQRDQALSNLAELVDVRTLSNPDGTGTVDVIAWGTALVSKKTVQTMTVGTESSGLIGVGIEGKPGYNTDARGGRIGGLISMKNDLLAEVRTNLDALAAHMMGEINRLHVQGVGTSGSFDALTGVRVPAADAALETWDLPVTAGPLHVRIVDPAGAGTTVRRIWIDPAADTLKTVAAKLNSLDPAHLSATAVDSRLHVEGIGGYRFDFLPASEAVVGTQWTGTSVPTEGGAYTGAVDQTYTFTAMGSGTVGVDAGLTVEARNAAGVLVATLDVGNTYVAGTPLAVDEGLTVSLAAGTLVAGEQFAVEATADPAGPGFAMVSEWSGTAAVALTGIYDGSVNDRLTVTVQSGGAVGIDAGVVLEVRNGAGQLITTFDVGRGYGAGEAVEIYEGLAVSFGAGSLTAGEQFGIDVLADSDPSGFLAAAGINALFTGTGASDMAVRGEILDDPGLLATARGTDGLDNLNVRHMADTEVRTAADLDGSAPGGFLSLVISEVGQKIAIRQARIDAAENVSRQLETQIDAISGVDLNDEATRLMVFERMYQSMAKVLGVQQNMMQTLIELL